jgi:hypothetical protein
MYQLSFAVCHFSFNGLARFGNSLAMGEHCPAKRDPNDKWQLINDKVHIGANPPSLRSS